MMLGRRVLGRGWLAHYNTAVPRAGMCCTVAMQLPHLQYIAITRLRGLRACCIGG